jgi:hypothetical protein
VARATRWIAQYGCHMQRRVIWVIGGWCVAVVLLAAVATAGPVHLWHDPRPTAISGDTSGTPVTAPTDTLPQLSRARAGHAPDWVGIAIEIMVAVVIAALIAMTWRHRTRIPWHRRERIRLESVPPDVETAVAEDARAQRDALEYGDVRNAIVACWLRLEAAVEAAGVVRQASDTSTDLATRVLGERAVDAPALETLAALFREARFSSHMMDEGHREAALDALDRIHASLGVRLETAGTPG